MRKSSNTSIVRRGLRVASALTLAASLSAFGCSTNRMPGTGEPDRGAGTGASAPATTPGSSGGSTTPANGNGSAALATPAESLAIMQAREARNGRVLGVVNPALPGEGQATRTTIVTGQLISPAMIVNPAPTVNPSLTSPGYPAIIGEGLTSGEASAISGALTSGGTGVTGTATTIGTGTTSSATGALTSGSVNTRGRHDTLDHRRSGHARNHGLHDGRGRDHRHRCGERDASRFHHHRDNTGHDDGCGDFGRHDRRRNAFDGRCIGIADDGERNHGHRVQHHDAGRYGSDARDECGSRDADGRRNDRRRLDWNERDLVRHGLHDDGKQRQRYRGNRYGNDLLRLYRNERYGHQRCHDDRREPDRTASHHRHHNPGR
jgi:hypothetical protein